MALFGRTNPPPQGDDKPSPAPPQPSAPFLGRPDTKPQRVEVKTTVIGPNVRIQGELSGDEDIVVEGRVEGRISVSKVLRIEPSAVINAEVSAQRVIIAGRVIGNVAAVERVEILSSGSLEGNIRAPKIAIAEGAQFKGNVDMASKAAPVAAPASASPSEKSERPEKPDKPTQTGTPPQSNK